MADAAAEQGVVVVGGQFEPGTVVELLGRLPDAVRSEGSLVRGRRVVDESGSVGFDGLEAGDKFWVVGYTAGKFLELPVVASESDVSGVQIPEQPQAGPVGHEETPVVVEPPAPTGEQPQLEVGVPDGATSGGVVDPGVSSPPPTDTPPSTEVSTGEAGAPAPEGATGDPAPEDPPAPPEPDPAPAPEEAPVPSDAPPSDSPSPDVPPVEQPPTPGGPADGAPEPSTPTEAPVPVGVLEQLVAQAESLGIPVEGAEEQGLREQITAQGQTPAA